MAEDSTTPPDADEAAESPTALAPDEGKLRQTVEISEAGPCKKHVKITVDRDDIDARFKEKYNELFKDRSSAIPGFRPGKAPRKYFERRFKDHVTEQVRTEVLMASLQQLAEDANINPLAPPDLKADKLAIPEAGPFVYEFDVEVRPEFDLPEYKGLKIRRPVKTFTDADIAREQRKLLEPYGQIVPKDGDHPVVEENDIIVADVTTLDEAGRVLNDLKEVRVRVERQLVLKDGVAENFSKQLAGAKAGDTRDIDIKLAESVANQSMKGTTVKARFAVKDVKVVRQPELTQALLANFDVRNEAQLQEKIASVLEKNLEYAQRNAARTQLLGLVAQDGKLQLPQDLLIRQAKRTLARKVMEMREGGMTDEQINARSKLLQQNAVQNTAVSLMEHFALQKIAEVEKIEIDDADIEVEIQRLAGQTGESYRKLKARLERDRLHRLGRVRSVGAARP